MNPRERILLAIVGAMVVLFAARWSVSSYLDKLRALNNEIKTAVKKRDQAEQEARKVDLARIQWRRMGKQTLSMDPEDAMAALRVEMYSLRDKAGLPNAPFTFYPPKKESHRLRFLNCMVKAEGLLDHIVDFLFMLECQPYVLRCKSVIIEPVTEKSGRGGRKGGPRMSTGRMLMTARIETLILPDTGLVPKREVAAANLDPARRRPVERTVLASAKDYMSREGGITRALFEPAKPPIPAPGKAAGPTPGHNATVDFNENMILRWRAGSHAKRHKIYFGEKSPPPEQGTFDAATYKPKGLAIDKTYYWRVDEINDTGMTEGEVWSFKLRKAEDRVVERPGPTQPKDGHMIVDRILSSPLTQQVVLKDPGKTRPSPPPDPKSKTRRGPPRPPPPAPAAAAEEKRVEVGEEMYGGILIFVHPRGAVSEGKDNKRWFHPRGQTLQDGKELTEELDPEVFHELAKLEQQAAGISKRPG